MISIQIMLAPQTHAIANLICQVLSDRHEEIHTDAADTCHYPSSGIVIEDHYDRSPLAARGSRFGRVIPSIREAR